VRTGLRFGDTRRNAAFRRGETNHDERTRLVELVTIKAVIDAETVRAVRRTCSLCSPPSIHQQGMTGHERRCR
jgi:hypothetical protein